MLAAWVMPPQIQVCTYNKTKAGASRQAGLFAMSPRSRGTPYPAEGRENSEVFGLSLNCSRTPLSSPEVRKMLSIAGRVAVPGAAQNAAEGRGAQRAVLSPARSTAEGPENRQHRYNTL